METSVTVQDLDNLVQAIFDQKQTIEQKELELKELNKVLMDLKAKSVTYLKELNRSSYQTPFGTISLKERWRVSLPKSEEDREAFFSWLKEKNLYEGMVTVNANSLNSLYMSEWEVAQSEGKGMDFSVPGIKEPTLFEDLSIRKR